MERNFFWLLMIAVITLLTKCVSSSGSEKNKQAKTTISFKDNSKYEVTDHFRLYEASHLTKKAGRYEIPYTVVYRLNFFYAYLGHYSKGLYTDNVLLNNQFDFTLPNKTRILLNSGSTIAYNPEKPEIDFRGEGLFDMPMDDTKIILDDSISLTCSKGSRVNITAYQDYRDEIIRITPLKGTAKMLIKEKEVDIAATGMQMWVFKDYSQDSISKVDTSDVTCWTKGSFNYRSIDYKDLINRISRWYEKKVIDSVRGTWSIPFAGSFNDSLPTLIERLNKADTSIICRVAQDSIIMTPKHGKSIKLKEPI